MSYSLLNPACHQLLLIHLTSHRRTTFSRVSLHPIRLLCPRILHRSRRRNLKLTGRRVSQSARSKATSLRMIFPKIWRVQGDLRSQLLLLVLSLPLALSLLQRMSRQLEVCHHPLPGVVAYQLLLPVRLRYRRLQWVLLHRQQQPLPLRRIFTKSSLCLRRGLNLDLLVQEDILLIQARRRRPHRLGSRSLFLLPR